MFDDSPISATDSIFARAYAEAIKTLFQINVGGNFCVLTSPVTQRGMAAGDLIYPQMTNYLIYKFADALQYADNPTYTGGSAGSYVQQLRSYIDWVETKRDPSKEVADRMANARDAATSANTVYWMVQGKAVNEFNLVRDLYPSETFWEWAAANYPPLAAADRTRKSAQSELYQAMQLYFGPDAAVLSMYMDNITNAQSANALPGYNQDGLVDDQDLIAAAVDYANGGNKAPEQPIARSTIRVPAYSIATYISSVQAWITASAKGAVRDQIVRIHISDGEKTRWLDHGFMQIHGGGNVGFWPFLTADVYVDGKRESITLQTKGRENDISLQLAMIGVQKFDIRPGEWDIPAIKTLFPNRLPDAPDVLNSKVAKLVSVLSAYDVQLIVRFSSGMKEAVNMIYEEVKRTKGRMSIFGFRVTAGAEGGGEQRVDTKFDDVLWEKVTGTMTLTPTKGQVYPTILGAIAQRFD